MRGMGMWAMVLTLCYLSVCRVSGQEMYNNHGPDPSMDSVPGHGASLFSGPDSSSSPSISDATLMSPEVIRSRVSHSTYFPSRVRDDNAPSVENPGAKLKVAFHKYDLSTSGIQNPVGSSLKSSRLVGHLLEEPEGHDGGIKLNQHTPPLYGQSPTSDRGDAQPKLGNHGPAINVLPSSCQLGVPSFHSTMFAMSKTRDYMNNNFLPSFCQEEMKERMVEEYQRQNNECDLMPESIPRLHSDAVLTPKSCSAFKYGHPLPGNESRLVFFMDVYNNMNQFEKTFTALHDPRHFYIIQVSEWCVGMFPAAFFVCLCI